jgi:hypothetical protein
MPGISTSKMSIPFSRDSQSWESYWSSQPEVLFFGLYSEISGGQMPNKVTGSSDYLTVAGVAGSETYQCPNTAPYQTADTDYIWFNADTSQRTVATAELVGYDLQRTPVKYNDTTPNAIVGIMILNAAVIGTKRDNLFRDMWLPVLWDNNLNGNGHIKDNRVTQTLWWGDFEAESRSLFDRMNALSEAPAIARRSVLDTAIAADKAASLWSAKYDAFWLFAAHGNDSGLLNIMADEFNCTLVDTPAFAVDRGYTGATNKALNANYNLATDSTLFTRDDCSFGVYVRTNDQSAQVCGVIKAGAPTYRSDLHPRHTDNKAYYGCSSSGYDDSASTDSSGMWILSRISATQFIVYRNGSPVVTENDPSAALPSLIWHFLCYNGDGTLAGFTTREIALGFIGKGMSATDVTNFQTIWVDGYLASVGAKI